MYHSTDISYIKSVTINSANADEAGVLNLLCHGPLQESGGNLQDPISEKFMYMHRDSEIY
jgi:hypothetical protein